MVYTANIGNNQQVTIVNHGNQTSISLFSSTPGQQQSQTNSFTTGTWNQPPNLSKLPQGFVIELNCDRQQYFVLIQGNKLEQIAAPPSLNEAIPINLEHSAQSKQHQVEFEPMPPMEPMKMGNMSMSMNPLSMEMGNMSMSIGKNSKTTTTKNFCSQCGEKIKQSDRFCSSCGHNLDN